MRTNRIFAWAGALLLAASMMIVGGCASDEITPSSVRKHMTPELNTIAMTREQRRNNTVRSVNTTLRQIPDDWDRFWLVEDPVRLSVYPIP